MTPREQLPAIVVGGGPAGLSAALWLDKLGLPFVLLEARTRLAGELEHIHLPVTDFLGSACRDAAELGRRLEEQVTERRLPLRLGTPVAAIDPDQRRIQLAGGEELAGSALLLALGLQRRPLEVPGAQRYTGRGLRYSASSELERIAAASPVVVVGGGDGAYENALLLAGAGATVVLTHRRSLPSARPAFVARVLAEPRIERAAGAEALEILGDGEHLSGVRLRLSSGAERVVAAGAVVVKIGYRPSSELLRGSGLALDDQGYVRVDRELRTSLPGVYAAGDLANPHCPCLATAVGDGAMAARSLYDDLLRRGDPAR